jgi:adenylate cyclase
MRLSAAELATETGTTVDRIAEMTSAGILRPDRDGAFTSGDVQRVLVAIAMVDAGLTVETLHDGIEAGIVSFEDTDVIYPDPGRPGVTVSALAAEVGLSTDALLRVITALGIPRPDPAASLHEPTVEQLRVFVAAWRPLGDEEMLVRAARAFGEAMRRATEGWMGLFEEAVLGPLADRALPWSEMRIVAAEPGLRLMAAGRSMLPWLLDQHLFGLLNQMNFDAIERQLALLGIALPAPREPSAILFTDLAGYTRLTEERGDEVAAASATRLAELADDVARGHAGRLVKLLGDGVMLHFPHAWDAVAAAIALRDAMAPAGLPPAHSGIHAGRVIRREADFYGRTVNIAARLASAADPDDILLTVEAVEAARAGDAELPALIERAPMDLKGIPGPVKAFLIRP